MCCRGGGVATGGFVSADSVDFNPQYWEEYTNLQRVKHELIGRYCDGWFPKLGLWAGRILYLDTHAGRGKHLSGQLGSPLIALERFLSHRARDGILRKSEVVFFFIEHDAENRRQLVDEIAARGELPAGVKCQTYAGDCFNVLRELVNHLRKENKPMAPAFMFIDPYGFKVPGSVLKDLMKFERVELFVNIMWRELDMAIQQGDKPGMAATLTSLFNGEAWRDQINADTADERAEQAISVFRELTGAKWATSIRMLGKTAATRYLLLHLTNHDAGRDLMKDCLWRVCPDGGFYARFADNPHQPYLIEPAPDLAPLRRWIVEKLQTAPMRWQSLIDAIRTEIWREPQLNDVVRELRNENKIAASEFSGKFSPKNDPLLTLSPSVRE